MGRSGGHPRPFGSESPRRSGPSLEAHTGADASDTAIGSARLEHRAGGVLLLTAIEHRRPDVFVHPLTGEVVEDDLATLNEVVDATYGEIGKLRTAVKPLQERRAELRGPVSLPRRRYQTDTQSKICPSCGREWQPA